MKKIAFILFFILTQTAFSQEEVEFIAILSKREIALNEDIRVYFTFNKEGFDFIAPDFENFIVMGGPYQNVEQSIIEGNRRKFSKTYGYNLRPKKTGVLTIGSASVEIRGKTYTTAPVELIVTDYVEKPLPSDMEIELYFIAEVNRTEVYEKELFEVKYSLLFTEQTEVGIGKFIRMDSDSTNSENFTHYVTQEIKIEKEVYDEKPFFKAELWKFYYSPKKSGNLTLSPLEIYVDLEFPTGERERFGKPIYDKVVRRIKTDIVNINVKPLPEGKKYELVGRYNFFQNISTLQLKSDETFDIEMIVEGTGNQLVLPLPKPDLSEGLEIVETKEEKPVFHTDKSEYQLKITYTIKPKYTGKHIVNKTMYAYFNPDLGDYIYDSKEEQTITVID